MMENEIERLKIENRTASPARKAEIDARMKELASQDPETFAKAFEMSLKGTIAEAEILSIKEQLKPIFRLLSMSYVSKEYFSKSKEWLYQRINGSMVNGKPAHFTQEEIAIFNKALKDISVKIGSVNVSL